MGGYDKIHKEAGGHVLVEVPGTCYWEHAEGLALRWQDTRHLVGFPKSGVSGDL